MKSEVQQARCDLMRSLALPLSLLPILFWSGFGRIQAADQDEKPVVVKPGDKPDEQKTPAETTPYPQIIEAIPAALRYAGLKLEDIGWIELNEAFAAQALAVINTVGLDPSKVNPMGGAIALGHPLGATGAIRAATVVHALRRHKLKYGMVTMCVGMGQGGAGSNRAP